MNRQRFLITELIYRVLSYKNGLVVGNLLNVSMFVMSFILISGFLCDYMVRLKLLINK